MALISQENYADPPHSQSDVITPGGLPAGNPNILKSPHKNSDAHGNKLLLRNGI